MVSIVLSTSLLKLILEVKSHWTILGAFLGGLCSVLPKRLPQLAPVTCFNKEFSVPWWEALQYFAVLSVAPRQGSLVSRTFITVQPTQPTWPLPDYGPNLMKPLIALDRKKTKNLNQDEATTTATYVFRSFRKERIRKCFWSRII